MKHIMGPDWRKLFDVVVCLSKKPKFFEDKYRVFRRLTSHNTPAYGEVKEFREGWLFVYPKNLTNICSMQIM